MEVLPATIEHAMQMVGATSIGTKGSIVAGVFERLGVASEEVDLAVEEEQDEGEDFTEDRASIHESIAPGFSQHQSMYAPLVRLPSTLGSSKTPYVYHGYRRTSISLEPEDPLLPSVTDEEALAEELREEEELDAQDRIAAEKNENRLWGEHSRRNNRGAAVATVEEHDVHELRFKPPGIDGHVKSQVYVYDSDSE